MPAAPVSVPPDALNVPEPRPSRLMPLPALFVELTVSKASVGPLVPLTSTAGPPVALTFAVPPAGTVTLPALLSRKAAALPDVVVSARLPKVVVPVVPVSDTPPLPEAVTVMSSTTLPVPRLVPAASSPRAPFVVIEIVPAEARLTVPALLRRTPIDPLVTPVAALLSTVRAETSNVPVVPSSSRPGCVPAVPVSTMRTSSIVPPPVSPEAPAMPLPAPCGSTSIPRTTLPSSSATTSASVSVSVGRAAGSAAWSTSEPIWSVAASPSSRWPLLRSMPAA